MPGKQTRATMLYGLDRSDGRRCTASDELQDGHDRGRRFAADAASAWQRHVTVSAETWALLAIMLAVLLANAPYLFGFFDPNPFDFRGGLTSSITHGLLGGRPWLDPANGFVNQAIGHRAALDILHLHLPWWNPYEATGMPLAGETQVAALFPPTLLTAFSNGQLYEHILLELAAGSVHLPAAAPHPCHAPGCRCWCHRFRAERQVRLVRRRHRESTAVPADVAPRHRAGVRGDALEPRRPAGA